MQIDLYRVEKKEGLFKITTQKSHLKIHYLLQGKDGQSVSLCTNQGKVGSHIYPRAT